MKSSNTIVELAKALNKAQAKMGGAVKGAANPYFKSKYADLNSVIEACKEHLNSEGISVIQPVVSDETGDHVETILVHTSGEYIASRMRLKVQKENDMQAYGSAISYARRYGLQSMVFIPSSEDDDGEKAIGRSNAQPTKPAQSVNFNNIPLNKPVAPSAKSAVEAPVLAKEPVVAATKPPVSEKPTSFFKKSTTAAEWK